MTAPPVADTVARTTSPVEEEPRPVLAELRETWWETGLRARAHAGLATVARELPRLIGAAMRITWRADRTRTLIVLAATIASGAMSTAGLLATRSVLTGLFAAGPTPDRMVAALPALVILAVLTAIRAGLGIASSYAQNGLTPRVDREVGRRLFESTTAVRLDAFDRDAFADDMERASRGTNSAITLVNATINFLAGLIGLVAISAAVTVIHPLLLCAVLVATLPVGWATLRAGHQRYRTFVAGSVRRRRLNILHRLMADRQTAGELRAYGLRGFLLGQYDTVMDVETRIQLELARKVTTTTSIGSIIGGIATGAVYALLGWLLWSGAIPLAAAATAVIALQAARQSLSTITFQVDRIYTEGRHFDDYTEFMQRARLHMPTRVGTADPGTLHTLTIEDVVLTYPDRGRPAVDNMTLTIRAGQTVAFVGENGSGKTTLAALIAALRTPNSGTIAWNGVSLSELDPDALRSRIGIVSQEYWKWPFTAATNIAIGDTSDSPGADRLEAAARRAVAHDMIMALPHGYDTLLDRTFADGQDLSGGQWQRITAARGFLRDAELLLMDEPSSALDPRAEDALFQAIRDRQGEKTTILITHRLANVRHADQIFVLHQGCLIESGSHEELMAADGSYAELFTLQASGYQDPGRRGC